MKTIEDFIKEIEGSEALQNELRDIKDDKALAVFLENNAYGISVEAFVKAMKARSGGEISEEEAEVAAGGISPMRDEPHLWSNYETFLPF